MKIDKPGVYKMRCGGEIEIVSTDSASSTGAKDAVGINWQKDDGRFCWFLNENDSHPFDLVEWLRPLPVKMQLGWWQARNGEVRLITRRGQGEDGPWTSNNMSWFGDGTASRHRESEFDLINFLGNGEKPDFTLYK